MTKIEFFEIGESKEQDGKAMKRFSEVKVIRWEVFRKLFNSDLLVMEYEEIGN